MLRFVKIIVPAGIVTTAILLSTATTWAKPEYARRTNKECAFCHPSDSWKLNDAGKYYRDHKYSLDGYKTPGKGK